MSSMLDVRRTLCRQCNVCYPMFPKQEKELSLEPDGVREAPVLVINDNQSGSSFGEMLQLVGDVLGLPSEMYTYTESIRCHPENQPHTIDWDTAAARCSVWTHLLADNRIVIISTRTGLNQLDVPSAVDEGDSFKNLRLGVVLCIPPLAKVPLAEYGTYRSKVQRVLKEAGLREKVTA